MTVGASGRIRFFAGRWLGRGIRGQVTGVRCQEMRFEEGEGAEDGVADIVAPVAVIDCVEGVERDWRLEIGGWRLGIADLRVLIPVLCFPAGEESLYGGDVFRVALFEREADQTVGGEVVGVARVVHARRTEWAEREPCDVTGCLADGWQDARVVGVVVDVPQAVDGDGEIAEVRAVVFGEPAFIVLKGEDAGEDFLEGGFDDQVGCDGADDGEGCGAGDLLVCCFRFKTGKKLFRCDGETRADVFEWDNALMAEFCGSEG